MEGIPTDISTWFANIPALAAVVAAIVALVRKHFFQLDGKLVIALSAAIGVALGYAGKMLGFLGADWVYFGLMAGLTASGGVDLVKSLTGAKGNAKTNSAGLRRL